MFEEYKYKIELHSHSLESSWCSSLTPAELVDSCYHAGADGVVVTNHFANYFIKRQYENVEDALDFYFNDYNNAVEEGEKLGIKVLFGMELCFADSNRDYLIYGVDREDARQIFGMLDGSFAEFREKFRSERAIVLQAHPHRHGEIDIDTCLLDGVEAFNTNSGSNSRVALTAKKASQDCKIATCGSDTHSEEDACSVLACFKKMPNDTFELAEMLRSGDFIFDIQGFLILPPKFQNLQN